VLGGRACTAAGGVFNVLLKRERAREGEGRLPTVGGDTIDEGSKEKGRRGLGFEGGGGK
jgi:hypothetical protein